MSRSDRGRDLGLRIDERAATGIAGFDPLIGGGLPRRHFYVVEGASGSGKTTFALRFAVEGVRQGETVLYVNLSESEEELRQIAAAHDWRVDGMLLLPLKELAAAVGDLDYTLFHPAEIELGEAIRRVIDALQRHRPSRLVVDSLSEFRLLACDPLRHRRQMLALREAALEVGATAVVLDELPHADGPGANLRTLAHGVVTLEQRLLEYGGSRRRLRVEKLRGLGYRSGHHDFRIAAGGIRVFPRLDPSTHRPSPAKREIASGIDGLDALLGGPLTQGTSMLVAGPAGSGKTTVAMHYAAAARRAGLRASVFLFDEAVASFSRRWRLAPEHGAGSPDEGLVAVHAVDPAELSPGELAAMVQREVEERGVDLLILDSASGYLHAMPEERYVDLHFSDLLKYLSNAGVISIVILSQHGLNGTSRSLPADISYLADTLLFLRFFEARGRVRRAISVLKKRYGDHERSIRELAIDARGIRVGEPLREFEGILTGNPRYIGPHEPLLERER